MSYLQLIFCITLLIASSVATSEKQPSDVNLSKRNLEELSYSYAATDIGSKSGTRIKTITVIKNVANKKHRTLKINPELHQNEDWGSEFRDNFDKIGKIPEIPDVFSKEKEEASEQEQESQEEAKINEMPKDSIPIYEEPESETQLKAEDSAEETKEEISSEEPTKSSRVISKLPKDIELIEIGPISLKQAEQSAKSQALRLKTYRSEEKELKEYIHNSPSREFRPIKPLLSKAYISEQLELNTSEEKPRAQHTKHYTAAESNAQSIYANYPAIKYTNLQQFSTTTVANPYIAPSKKSQALKRFGSLQNQNSAGTSDPYIAPSIRKAYTTIKPATLPLGSIPPFTVTRNPNPSRFRGLRY